MILPRSLPCGSVGALFALGLAGQVLAAQTVSGVVTNPSGEAVPGVTLSLRTADGDVVAGATSAGDGGFALTIPSDGEFRVHADAAGHLPTVSHLFALRAEGLYQIDVEVRASPPAHWTRDLPRERYEEWVRSHISGWQTRDVVIVSGAEWRQIAGGRDLFEALELAGLPRVSLQRVPTGFCARSGSSTKCMSIAPLSHAPVGRLRDVEASEVDAVVYLGPTVRSAPSSTEMAWQESAVNASIILFMNGYLLPGG